MRLHNLILLEFIILFILIPRVKVGNNYGKTANQLPGDWSPLTVVFQDNSGVAEVKPAIMAIDSRGVGHLFWLYKRDIDDPSTWSINYAQWNEGNWSSPVDILAFPNGKIGYPNAVAGTDGFLRLIVTGGAANRLWYIRAPISNALDVHYWSEPMVIADYAIDSDLVQDQNGGLHVVFTTGEPNGPVYYIHSLDGSSWSPPILAYKNAPKDVTSGEPRISVDGRGRIHITWTDHQLPEGWPPLGQWYGQSQDGGKTWNDAIQVGGNDQGQGAVLAVGFDQIHLVWRGTTAAGNTYHQWSDDGGKSWRGPVIFDPDGGFSGRQSLAADSAGNVHLVRSDGGYQVWENGVWSPVPALFADTGETGTVSIGLGNQIHWINTTEVGAQPATIWHRVKIISTEAIPTIEIPQPTRTIYSYPLAEKLQTAEPTTVNIMVNGNLLSGPEDNSSVGRPLAVGVFSSIILFVIVALLRAFSIKSRRI